MSKLIAFFVASACAEEAVEASAYAGMSLMSKGLIVTLFGLAGVFLVLLLFFLTIKLMQKLK